MNPWSMAFLPNGEMRVTERSGRLRMVRGEALDPDPIEGVTAVHDRGDGGLLDVALHPGFATNRLLYLSYAKPNAGGTESTTAVVRGRLDGNRLTDVQEIFEAMEWTTTNGHYGSRLAFDREGYLYITVGDGMAPPSGDLAAHPAQDLGNHQGTIVRLHDDGRVPTDNPFVGRQGALPEIWSYGHRNLQGLVVHPETGDLWQTEHGPQGGDELNLVLPGRNYGWPVVGYGVNYDSGLAIHEGTQREGMENWPWRAGAISRPRRSCGWSRSRGGETYREPCPRLSLSLRAVMVIMTNNWSLRCPAEALSPWLKPRRTSPTRSGKWRRAVPS